MNRRSFLTNVAGLAASALVPTWAWSRPHPINLKPFCLHENGGEYWAEMRLGSPITYHIGKPFVQEVGEQSSLIATDGKTCVRVDVDPRERDGESLLRPPIGELPWTGDLRWRPWPAKHHMLARDTECPKCDGEGFVVKDGMAFNCELCDGEGCGVFPGVQVFPLGNGKMYVDAVYDQRIRTYLPDPEWAPVYNPVNKSMAMAIRFRGGMGIQSRLDEATTEERLRRTR